MNCRADRNIDDGLIMSPNASLECMSEEEIMNFGKSKSDCLIHDFLKTYIKKKSNLASCEDNEASMLRMRLKDYTDILEPLLKRATCFPSGCENCVGMQKCINCINQNDLAATFVKLQNDLYNEA
jgi:hypothetical protein